MYQIFPEEILGSGQFGTVFGGMDMYYTIYCTILMYYTYILYLYTVLYLCIVPK